MNNSPHVRMPASVRSIMLRVLLALVPGVLAHAYFFGPAILVSLALSSATALLAEAAVLLARGRPVGLFLSDGSALVTAWLISLAMPSLLPWWAVVLATLIAIVVAKHLFGGLGQNPFNPAMVAYAVMIVAYPRLMSGWPALAGAPGTDFASQLAVILQGIPRPDAMTMATPLDTLRTALHLPDTKATVDSVLSASPGMGLLGGQGLEVVALAYALGGLWLLQQRIITWHVPVAFLATLALVAGVAHAVQPQTYAGPLFHLVSGGTLLGAFFILTDPVSGSTTPRGKLIFAAGAALLVWLIRNFGAYPDGVAFAVLIMNLCVPLIDMHTQPPVFGHKGGKGSA